MRYGSQPGSTACRQYNAGLITRVQSSPPYMTHRPPRMTHRPPHMTHRPPHMTHRPPHMTHQPPHMTHRTPHLSHTSRPPTPPSHHDPPTPPCPSPVVQLRLLSRCLSQGQLAGGQGGAGCVGLSPHAHTAKGGGAQWVLSGHPGCHAGTGGGTGARAAR